MGTKEGRGGLEIGARHPGQQDVGASALMEEWWAGALQSPMPLL